MFVKFNECPHFFHRECIEKWFKNKINCPICRRDYWLILLFIINYFFMKIKKYLFVFYKIMINYYEDLFIKIEIIIIYNI